MAEWLPADHLVWFVLDVVDELDTTAFHAQHPVAGPGRAAYDPDMLLALLVYAYAVGERSSRRIERLCHDHVAFRVLCAQDAPDHTTIARFRSRHEALFAELFARVLRLCSAAGMVKVGMVAIDGTKIAADAARGANRTQDWVREQATTIARQVVAEATEADATEDAEEDSDGQGPPPGFTRRGGRAANIRRALAELDRQDAAAGQADATDRAEVEEFSTRVEAGESGLGRPPAGVDLVRYHRARLARYQRRAEEAASSNARRDARAEARKAARSLARAEEQEAAGQLDLRGRAARARDRRAARQRARGGTGPTVNTTDPESRLMTHGAGGGSVQGYNAQIAVSDDHFIVGTHLSQDANDANCFAPMLRIVTTAATGLGTQVETVLADAGYFTEENLTMPGPERLIAPGKNRDLARQAIEEPAHGPPPVDAEARDQMRHRLRTAEGHELYKRRSATVETVIAHLKDQTALRRFARRGLTAAAAELDLAATAINIRRWHSAQLPA